MEFDTDRREFLGIAGTSAALSLTGCSATQNDAGSETTAPPTQSTLTVVVEADQQKLQQHRQKIRSELQSGNMTRREAQQRYRQVQRELRSKAASAFVKKTDLTIEDSVERFGVFLVTGAASRLVNALSFTEVRGLFPEDVFQRAKSQAEQGTPTPSE